MLTEPEPEPAAAVPTRRSSPALGEHLAALLDAVAEGIAVLDAARALAAEAAQLEAEKGSAQLVSIFNGITDPFSVLDRDLRIVYVNEVGARLVGKKPHEIIGKRAWDLAPEVKDGPVHK